LKDLFVDGAQVHVTLGKGDFNACFPEKTNNLLAEVAPYG
jgi:hypothetical protein